MTRITPRTCLYPLTASWLFTFALSVALTYRSNHHCYAATCGEWLFPLQARLHVVVWYCWIAIFAAFLAVRAFSAELRRFLRYPLLTRELPVVQRQVSVSGLLAVSWIVALYGTLVGVWWVQLRDYFVERGRTDGVVEGNRLLAAVALTGHFCDVTMGMVLIPVSRHSALASFFSLSVSTTLTFHMITAYTLFALVLVHAFLYVAWVPYFHTLGAQLRMVFPVLNPTYLYEETWPGNSDALGVWRASLIFTGIFATTVMGLIFVTTLPKIRKKHFNLFYYTHLLVIAAVIVICLHASTVFYCAAPGLSMWLLDWGMRFYELRQKLDAKIVCVGKGWYSITLRLPRRRLDGCACTSPLAHFYLYHSDTSIRQLHPFTTITHLASQNMVTPPSRDEFPIQFLFRKQGRNQPAPSPMPRRGGLALIKGLARQTKVPTTEWTDKLAGLADGAEPTAPKSIPSSPASPSCLDPTPLPQSDVIGIRVEGPYFTPADPSRHHTVVCFVAGTGVSGAIAIVNAFIESRRQRGASSTASGCLDLDACSVEQQSSAASKKCWERCLVIWSVKEEEYVDLPFLKEDLAFNLEIRVHLTGRNRPRLDFGKTLEDVTDHRKSVWVYISGPNAFIDAGEKACQARPGVEWHGARWNI